ncbi:MAG: hypothetical protein SPF22_07650 [Candidatus Onthovivens sp.]|nr:hypothetical protein [Candidatus Onthovivens sp.]
MLSQGVGSQHVANFTSTMIETSSDAMFNIAGTDSYLAIGI